MYIKVSGEGQYHSAFLTVWKREALKQNGILTSWRAFMQS